MSCKTSREMLHSYINNELDLEAAKSVSLHLEACADCRREAEEITKLKAVISSVKPDQYNISGLKENIMSVLEAAKRAPAVLYDYRVLKRLGASLIACGLLVLFINFAALNTGLGLQGGMPAYGIQEIEQKITQPLNFINKGFTDMSDKIMKLNGITFRLEQKIRGGI